MNRTKSYRIHRAGMGIILVASMCVIAIAGCSDGRVRVPKPRAYPRVVFPERVYTQFEMEDCPLAFQYPEYMTIVKRENFFDNKPAHPCWFDLDAPALGARIHCSYYPVSSAKSFSELVTDAFRMADRINQRANYMDELRIGNAQGVSGLLMEFAGSAASPLHFYLTDSTQHFLKASLYFQSKVIPDSLAPITDFLREDLAVMINSMTFR